MSQSFSGNQLLALVGERFGFQLVPWNDAHRRLERGHRLEEILSVGVARTVAGDHTVSWNGQRWGLRRYNLRGARSGRIQRRINITGSSNLPGFPAPCFC